MAEIKRLWIVATPPADQLVDMWTDPAYQDDDHRIMHFCGALAESDGYSIDQFVRVYWGGKGHLTWDKERSKLYSDEASAKKDATARFEKAKRKYAPKTAASRVAARYSQRSSSR